MTPTQPIPPKLNFQRHWPEIGSSTWSMSIYPKLIPLVAWLAACSAGSAADRYVSTSGANTNPGTLELPWRTIQKAADSVVGGDVVHIRAGVYTERVTITNKDGTAQSPIIFQKYAADNGTVVIDQTGVTPVLGNTSALLWIENSDYIRLQNLEFANYKTTGTNDQQKSQLPVGIYITGDGNGLTLSGCKVHDIWQSCTTRNDQTANAFGIAVYGTATTAINNLTIEGCEVYNLRTGASESVVLNGNVTNFTVANNLVYDCNNIGIDFIGFEGTNANQVLDQARNGVCRGNTVYRIDSKYNPAYGGNFTTGGGNGTRSAPGLYVDGGRDIVLERNHVYDCNFAVSVGSEHLGKLTSNVAVRNNILHHCHVGGIVLGGSSDQNGGADNCSITNNTLYDNDTVGYGGGQVMIQNYVTNTTIKRNLIVATAGFVQFILKESATGNFAAGAIDWNRYRHNSGSSYEFIWNGTPYDSFANWKSGGALAKDSNAILSTVALGLVNNAPTVTSPATDFALTSASPARDTGDSAAVPFVPTLGERDYSGQSRVANGRVDIGANEYLTNWQSWRDLYFGLPDGGTGANALDDADVDKAVNLLEYSQGMNPLVADTYLLPYVTIVNGNCRIYYRKAAPELSYNVEQSANPTSGWVVLINTESTNGSGLYWREQPLSSTRGFLRLAVTQP